MFGKLGTDCNNPAWPARQNVNIGIHTGPRTADKALHIDGFLDENDNCADPAIKLSFSQQTFECWGHLLLRTPVNQYEIPGFLYSNLSSFGDLVLQAGRISTTNQISSNLILTNRNPNTNSKIKFGLTPRTGMQDFEAMTIMNDGYFIGKSSIGINCANPKNDLTLGQNFNFYNGNNTFQYIGFNQYNSSGTLRISGGRAAQIANNSIIGTLSISSANSDFAGTSISYAEPNSGYRGIVFRSYTNSTNIGIGSQPDADSRVLITAFGNDNSAAALSILNTSVTNNSIFYVRNDGNIGIGTTSPERKLTVLGDVQIGTYYYTGSQNGLDNRLSVDGQIACKEIIVELSHWPDDVFHKNYKLTPINQLEKNIRILGHLPEIPSESEVKENGVNLAEMQSKLLRKIEELTLYVIDLKKENDLLKVKVSTIESQIK